MCKHCDFTYASDRENITGRPIKMLNLTDCRYVELELWRYKCDNYSENKLLIEYGVKVPCAPKHMIKYADVKIKYCPFCGEKL